MTDPVKTTNTIKIGGVEYSKTEVSTHSVEKKQATNSNGIWVEYEEHKVTLRDGTTLVYKKQDDTRQATVDIADDHSVNFFGLNDVSVFGRAGKQDNYKLFGCEGAKVKVYDRRANYAATDTVEFHSRMLANGEMQYSANNSVSADANDKINGNDNNQVKITRR